MADDTQDPKDPNDPRKLPWPEETDPSRLAERFEHQGSPEDRDVAASFERSTEASQRELGREFADPNYADSQKVAASFADPNSLDDGRLGRSFEETNSSAKKKKPPVAERVHKPESRRPLYLFILAFLILFVLIVVAGWLMRRPNKRDTEKSAEQERNAKPVVQAIKVGQSKDQEGLVVPGTTIPLTEAYVYARANGYLKTRFVDIGDKVKKNQLLAIVDAPDLDAQVDQARQQLHQAQQQLEQQKSQLILSDVTVQRYRVLVQKGVFSRQDGDQQEANFASQVANVAAAQRNVEAFKANLDRQITLQGYEYVRAPFAGVITQRNVEVGALISAAGATSGGQTGPAPQGQNSTTGGTQQAAQTNNSGSSGSPNTSATSAQSPGQGGPLFGLAQVQRLRILVSVPEGYATAIHPGLHAQLAFQEYAAANFIGDITRTANSIDANTRTLLTEVQVDNSSGKLIPGMYVVVTFPPVSGGSPPILITGDAVVVRHDRSVVATIVDGKIRYVPVVLGRDFGSSIEILNGLKVGDLIVTDVTDDVVDGAEVKVQQGKPSEQQPAPTQSAPPGGNSQYGNQGITDENMQNKQSQQNQKSNGQQSKGNQKSSSESKP
jgi:multidrug efflux pump subunit AcrA (membrane-fusion protein)